MRLWKRKTPIGLWRWNSNVRITARYQDGTTEVDYLHNLLMRNGFAHVLDGIGNLLDAGGDVAIRYLAVGSGTTAVNDTQGYLVNETFRKQITSAARTSHFTLETITIINNDEAVGTIEEIGWFGGVAATSTTDSGILYARVLYSRTKTALESLQIDRIDTFSEV